MHASRVLLLLSLASLACATGQTIEAPPQLAGVRNECRKLVADGRLPSIAIAVARDGQTIWKQAFGMADREAGRAATTNTIYTLASTGKSITGTAVLVAAQKGILDLDAPVTRYLGDALRIYQGDPESITVRALAAMEVGIPHLWWHHWHDGGAAPLDNAEIVRRYGIVTAPRGSGFHYSNLTYGVLAQVVENAAGMPFHDFVRRHVFEPLGMTHATLRPEHRFDHLLAASYGDRLERRPYWYSDPEGGAGYRASITDLLRYGMFHLGDWQPKEDVIDRDLLSAVHDVSKTGYRFGWAYVDDASGLRTALANGGIVGAASVVRLVPSHNIAVAVLSNYPDRVVDSIADRVIAALVPEYRAEFVIPPEFHEKPFVADDDWKGEWNGEVRTWEGSTPVTIRFEPKGARMVVRDEAEVTLENLIIQNGTVRGRCACTIPLSDTHGEPSRLNIALRRDGDRLYGSATVISTGPRTNFALPAYIELLKAGR